VPDPSDQIISRTSSDSLTGMDSAAPQPTFRPATVADVPGIVALIESAYRGEASRAGWTTEADLIEGQRTDAESVLAVITKSDSRLIVVTVAGGAEPVACCQLEHRGEYAYFGMFAVRPGLQGAGLGKAVLAEAERFAYQEWGVAEMRMTVISLRTDLVAWYVRRGYERTGQTSPFPYGDERAGRPTRDDLEFELLTKKLS
jgi:GNAT superfamily N-acetyltransferase